MSISSCPRCTQQVTLPMGISNSAQVRCPLCRAEYSLADALVNMPPLLEVIGDAALEPSGDWFDMPGDRPSAGATPLASVAMHESAADFGLEPELAAPEEPSDELNFEEDLKFEAVEVEHDDIAIEQQDTEIEELAFAPADPLGSKTPSSGEPGTASLADDDNVLDIDQSDEASAEPEVAEPVFDEPVFDETALAEAKPAETSAEEFGIDFGDALSAELPADEPAAAGDDELGFDAPQEPTVASDDLAIDFAEPQPADANAAEVVLDFGQPGDAPAGEEIGLDFGEAVAAGDPPPETEAAEEPAAGKKSKSNQKKSKLIKPPADAPRKRSRVGTLTSVVLSGVVAVALTLYGALWISPDYDFLGVGPPLAGYGLAPSSFNKRAVQVAQATTIPNFQLPTRQPLPAGDATGGTSAPTPPNEPQVAEGAPPATDPPVQEKQSPAAAPEPAATGEPAASEPQAPAPPAESETKLPASDTPEPAAPETSVPEAKPHEPPAEPNDDSLDALLKDDAAGEVAKKKEMPGEKANVVENLPEPEPTANADQPPALPSAAAPGSDAKEEVTPAAAGTEALGPRDARVSTAAELAKAMQSYSQAHEKMTAVQSGEDKTELKKVRAGYYLSFYGLAETLALAKDDPAGGQLDAERQGVERLAKELAGDAARLSELKSYGAKWLAFAKRTTPGVVLAGTVQSAEQVGKLYHVKIELTADAPAVTIVSDVDPRVDALDEVLALGSIVERPDEQLAGYMGADAAVVWSGMTLKLPAK